MSAGEAGFDYIIERERGLRRDLTARRMTMIAIGGAIGTGLFLGSGFAIGLAGPGVLVSYVIGALIALLLMGCLAEMTVATRLPGPSALMPSTTSARSPAISCVTPTGPATCSRSGPK